MTSLIIEGQLGVCDGPIKMELKHKRRASRTASISKREMAWENNLAVEDEKCHIRIGHFVFIYLSILLSVYPSIPLSLYPSIRLYVYPYIHLLIVFRLSSSLANKEVRRRRGIIIEFISFRRQIQVYQVPLMSGYLKFCSCLSQMLPVIATS